MEGIVPIIDILLSMFNNEAALVFISSSLLIFYGCFLCVKWS